MDSRQPRRQTWSDQAGYHRCGLPQFHHLRINYPFDTTPLLKYHNGMVVAAENKHKLPPNKLVRRDDSLAYPCPPGLSCKQGLPVALQGNATDYWTTWFLRLNWVEDKYSAHFPTFSRLNSLNQTYKHHYAVFDYHRSSRCRAVHG